MENVLLDITFASGQRRGPGMERFFSVAGLTHSIKSNGRPERR